MLSRRQLRLFTVFTLFFAIAQASWFDFNLFGRDNGNNALSARQSDSNSTDPNAQQSSLVSSTPSSSLVSSTPSSTPSSQTSESSASPSSTPPSSTPSSTPVSSTPSSSSPTPSSTPTTSQASSTTTDNKKTKTSSSSSTTSKNANTSPSVAVLTSVLTVSGSLTTSLTSSTSSSTPTGASGQISGDGTSSSSGISSKTKNTIIGVVVGIGGAAILAGLFVVAWRIWGRKKSQDDDDGLMGYRGGSSGKGHEKSNSVSAAGAPNPFQSTLEGYHNPTRNVNASSNF